MSERSTTTNSSFAALWGGENIDTQQLDTTQGSWEAATLIGGGGESPRYQTWPYLK